LRLEIPGGEVVGVEVAEKFPGGEVGGEVGDEVDEKFLVVRSAARSTSNS
jgi:hypothetical protein